MNPGQRNSADYLFFGRIPCGLVAGMIKPQNLPALLAGRQAAGRELARPSSR